MKGRVEGIVLLFEVRAFGVVEIVEVMVRVSDSRRVRFASRVNAVTGCAVAALLCVLCLGSGLSVAQSASSTRPIERELIFGAELMTDEELDRYRDEIGRQGTDAARNQYRERHRERLRERARGRGLELREPAGVLRRRDGQ